MSIILHYNARLQINAACITGSAMCSLCEPGSSTDNKSGLTECTLCSPGHFAEQKGVLILKLQLLYPSFIDSYFIKIIYNSEKYTIF